MRYANNISLRKIFLCAFYLVLITFPNFSEEFNFGFGADDSNGGHSAAKNLMKKRPIERKFKFRKLERIDDTDNDISNDDDTNNENNDDDNDDDDDDDDNNDNISQGMQSHDYDAEDRSMNEAGNEHEQNDDEDDEEDDEDEEEDEDEDDQDEFVFERARKSQKDRRESVKVKHKLKKQRSKSFISTITFGLLGSGSAESGELKPDRKAINGNIIIDWLKWLGEKSTKSKQKSTPQRDNIKSESFMSYFNRWPFNALFPIGKPQKPIKAPRSSAGKQNNQKHKHIKHHEGVSAETTPSMNQAQMDVLLYRLPTFVINPSHVADTDCRQQLQVFQRQLRGHKLWAIQMLDATGKVSSGLLRGNINQFGDFDLCTQVRTLVKVTQETPLRIRGKYCLAHIETVTDVHDLKVPLYLVHGRNLWNSYLENPNHFVPRYSLANWGVCVPHACSADDVRQMFSTNLRPYNATGIEFHVELDETDCYIPSSNRLSKLLRKDDYFRRTFLMFLVLVSLIMIASGHEYWNIAIHKLFIVFDRIKKLVLKHSTDKLPDQNTNSEEGSNESEQQITVQPEEGEENSENTTTPETVNSVDFKTNILRELLNHIAIAFSPKATLAHLLSTEQFDTQFPIFHVLKLFAIFMLYLCMKFIMFGHLPITNLDQLVRTFDERYTIIFRVPFIYIDTLLLISGFVSAYKLSEDMETTFHIPVLKRITGKVLRYLPTLYVVLCFQTWILPYLNSGPLWSNLIGQNTRICEQEMWRNLFNLQNAIDVEETCSFMTIPLSIEVQLYLLSPLIVWLYYSNSDVGFYMFGALQALSVAASFSRTNEEHLSTVMFHGMNVSKFYRTANLLFASPISRATAFLLGIGGGILHRTCSDSLNFEKYILPYGWGLCILSIVWCFWSQAMGMNSDYVYTAPDAAAYAAWSPLILGMALLWLIFMFPKRENSIVRYITNSRPILFLSRISFPMQLSMYMVILYNTAKVREPLKYHMSDMINISEICIIVATAVVLAFIIDVPSRKLCKTLIECVFAERTETSAGGSHELSDGEMSDEVSDSVKKDATETEAIWASDPEEEEQKYIARRRSSTLSETSVGETVAVEDDDNLEKVEAMEAADVEEEQTDITEKEEEEVKKRARVPEPEESKEDEVSAQTPSYRRRRRPINED